MHNSNVHARAPVRLYPTGRCMHSMLVNLRPAAASRVLAPHKHLAVVGAAGEQCAKLGMSPRHLPHGALVATGVWRVH